MWGGVEETQKFDAGKHTSLHFFWEKNRVNELHHCGKFG